MSRTAKEDLVFKALSDSKRRKILDLLKSEPLTTGEICKHFRNIDRCTVMLHLSVLEKADLVIVKREGRYRWNYLNLVPIQKIYDRWISRYATHAVQLLEQMKTRMEQ